MNDFDPHTLLASLPARLGAIVRRWSHDTPHAPALHDGRRHTRCWKTVPRTSSGKSRPSPGA